MALLESIKNLFAQLFSRDPAAARRRAELKRVHAVLAEARPPCYKPKQNLVLPGFAQSVHGFASLLRPVAEIVRATIGAPDARLAQRSMEALIEARLPPEQRDRREGFAYETMLERVRGSLDPERELELLAEEFQDYLRALEDLGDRVVNVQLFQAERLADLCRHDFERLLALFDPRATLSNPDYKPDFGAADGEQVHPELADLYYVLEGMEFGAELREDLCRLIERRTKKEVDPARRAKVEKLFAQLQKVMNGRLDEGLLLNLMRACRGEPDYRPETPRERKDYVGTYRRRMLAQFDGDRDRLLRERHESSLAADIKSLFGEGEVLEVDGYDDETDAYVRKDFPSGFAWIKPLRVLKTFLARIFDAGLRESVKRILVEGYFDNKVFQNNLANILYKCERSASRLAEFEKQMSGNGRVSVVALRRYVEELRHGKDLQSFIGRMLDTINNRAREIVEEETTILAMLGEALGDIVSDARRPGPELVSNARNIAGARNKEFLAGLAMGRDRIDTFLKIMRSFSVVRATPVQGGSGLRHATVVEEVGSVAGPSAEDDEIPDEAEELEAGD